MCMKIDMDDCKDNGAWNVHVFIGFMLHFIIKMLIIQFYESWDFPGLDKYVFKCVFWFAEEFTVKMKSLRLVKFWQLVNALEGNIINGPN